MDPQQTIRDQSHVFFSIIISYFVSSSINMTFFTTSTKKKKYGTLYFLVGAENYIQMEYLDAQYYSQSKHLQHQLYMSYDNSKSIT